MKKRESMLDINLVRESNPEIIRESQRGRFASVEIIDEIIHLDKEWRQGQFELKQLRKDFNRINKEVAKLRIVTYAANVRPIREGIGASTARARK